MRPTWPAGLAAAQLDGDKDENRDEKNAAADAAENAHHGLQVDGRVPPALAVGAGRIGVGLGLLGQGCSGLELAVFAKRGAFCKILTQSNLLYEVKH